MIGFGLFVRYAISTVYEGFQHVDYGPTYFPGILEVICYILGGLIIVFDFIGLEPETKIEGNKEGMFRVLLLVVATIGYVLAMGKFGYLIPSIVFFGVAQLIYKEKNWIKLVILTVVFPVFVLVLFQYVLGVLLPR